MKPPPTPSANHYSPLLTTPVWSRYSSITNYVLLGKIWDAFSTGVSATVLQCSLRESDISTTRLTAFELIVSTAQQMTYLSVKSGVAEL